MPAAAVTPALIAYIKVVAVKKLVVGFRRALRLVGRQGLYRLGHAPL